MGLYEVLKAAKIGAASDVFTTLRGQQAPFAKGGSTEHEYTGTVPYTFTADGTPLIDWYIKGNTGGVGERTGNLCPSSGWEAGQYANGVWDTVTANRFTSAFFPIEEGKQYTIKINTGTKLSWININYFDSSKQWLGNRITLGMEQFSTASRLETTPSMPADSAYMRITVRPYQNIGDITIDDIPVSDIAATEGSTAIPYEPYGYKIPVTCGGETNTIYLDEPLGASDSISMTGTGVSIPTVNGSNTLSVGTTIQPSEVYIKWKG